MPLKFNAISNTINKSIPKVMVFMKTYIIKNKNFHTVLFTFYFTTYQITSYNSWLDHILFFVSMDKIKVTRVYSLDKISTTNTSIPQPFVINPAWRIYSVFGTGDMALLLRAHKVKLFFVHLAVASWECACIALISLKCDLGQEFNLSVSQINWYNPFNYSIY